MFHVKHSAPILSEKPAFSGFSGSEVEFLSENLKFFSMAEILRALPLLAAHLDELTLWAPRLNLVAKGGRQEWMRRHFLDSLLAAAPLRDACGPIKRLLDVGSGAGFPGIPLAALLQPDATHLVEPRKRRAHFLRAVRRRWPRGGLEVENSRLDQLDAIESFDAVVSRATFSDASEFLTGSARLVRPGGTAMLLCGNGSPLPGAETFADQYGPPEVRPYKLPDTTREYEWRLWRRH